MLITYKTNFVIIIYFLLISFSYSTAQATTEPLARSAECIPLTSGRWEGEGSYNQHIYPIELDIQQNDALFTAILKSPVRESVAIHYIKGEYSWADHQFICADARTDRDKPIGDKPALISLYTFQLVEGGAKLVGSAQIDANSKMLFTFTKKSNDSATNFQNTNEAAALVRDSRMLRESGKLDNARNLLKQACGLDPNVNSAVVHNDLGITLQQMGDLNLALNEFLIALTFKPDMTQAMYGVAHCYCQLGDFNQTVKYLQDLLNKYPDCTDASAARQMLLSVQNTPKLKDDPNANDYYVNAVTDQKATWSTSKLPITVFIESGKKIEGYQPSFEQSLIAAFNQWIDASNGRLSWKLISKKKKANIVCHWVSNRNHFTQASGGELGETLIKYAFDPRYLSDASIQSVEMGLCTVTLDGKTLMSNEEMNALCLHEVGHALGIKTHSSNNNDVMFFMMKSFLTSQLSPRDKATLLHLYSVQY